MRRERRARDLVCPRAVGRDDDVLCGREDGIGPEHVAREGGVVRCDQEGVGAARARRCERQHLGTECREDAWPGPRIAVERVEECRHLCERAGPRLPELRLDRAGVTDTQPEEEAIRKRVDERAALAGDVGRLVTPDVDDADGDDASRCCSEQVVRRREHVLTDPSGDPDGSNADVVEGRGDLDTGPGIGVAQLAAPEPDPSQGRSVQGLSHPWRRSRPR